MGSTFTELSPLFGVNKAISNKVRMKKVHQ